MYVCIYLYLDFNYVKINKSTLLDYLLFWGLKGQEFNINAKCLAIQRPSTVQMEKSIILKESQEINKVPHNC